MSDGHDWRRRRSTPPDGRSWGRRGPFAAGRPAEGDPEVTPPRGETTGRWVTQGPADGTEAGQPPINVGEVHFDERFIDALSHDVPVSTRDDDEYRLAALLSEWRHEVLDPPAPEMPTVDEVEHAIAASERAGRGRRMIRHLRVVSGAAAIVVVAGAGLTVLSEGSHPGDTLWGVKKVVFASAASQTQAMVDVQAGLERAESAMQAGDTAKASSLIAKAEKDLGPVRDEDTRKRMSDWIDRLRDDGGTTTGRQGPTRPGGPASPPRDLTTPLTQPQTTDSTDQRKPTSPETTDPRTSATTEPTKPTKPTTTEPTNQMTTKPTTTAAPTTTKPKVTTTPTVS